MARTRSSATATRYLLINPGRSGRVYNLAGHSLGGGERIVVDEVDSVGQEAVRLHYLIQRSIEGSTTSVPEAEEPEPASSE